MIRSLICHADADGDVFIRPTTAGRCLAAANLTFQAPSGSTNLTVADGATINSMIGIFTGNVALAANLIVDHNGTGTLTFSEANTSTRGLPLDSGKLKINNVLTLCTATAGAFVSSGGTIEKHPKSGQILISKSIHSSHD